jgi:hypothetical protein
MGRGENEVTIWTRLQNITDVSDRLRLHLQDSRTRFTDNTPYIGRRVRP